MKAGFPLSPADVVRTFESLRLDPPDLAREAYTFRQFVDELVVPSGLLRAVEVHKRRVRYVVGGCTSEVSDVVVDGTPDSHDRDRVGGRAAVMRAVAVRGPRRLPEHELPVGLRRAPRRDRPERFAVIDVGTNSIKFHVGERRPTAAWRRSSIGPRSPGSARACAEGGEITAEALAGRSRADRGHGGRGAASTACRAIAAVGTAGLRMAATRRGVVEAIQAATGVEDRGRSRGDEESRLAYLAVQAGLGLGRRADRRVRHRRRQHAVHVRPRRRRSTSGSA